jgi:peptide/nickel transport system permease protein
VLLGVTAVVFVFFRVLPAGVPPSLIPLNATPEQIELIEKRWGLDKPIWEQYVIFLQRLIFEQDLGLSYSSSLPVGSIISEKLPVTIELALVALILGIIVGVPMGIISAYFQRTKIDYSLTAISYIGMSLPIFWFAYILQMIFVVDLKWFIASGRIAPELELTRYTNFYLLDSFLMVITTGRLEFLNSVVNQITLPAVTLGFVIQAIIARTVRSLMIVEFQKEYVRTARSKGLKEQLVVINHATKNSLIPTVTIIGLLFGTLTVGSVIVEYIFNWQGLGLMLVDAMFARDYPLVMGGMLVAAVIFVIINTITDILYAYIDPRIRYHGRE